MVPDRSLYMVSFLSLWHKKLKFGKRPPKNTKMCNNKRWELGLSQVRPWLWIGPARAATSERISSIGVKLVVWATPEAEPPNLTIENTVLRIIVKDDPSANLRIFFSMVLDAVRACRAAEGSVVFICRAGISRSASLAIISVMSEEYTDLRSAYNIVKAGRPIIRPNTGFFRQMIEYESEILGAASVKMTKSPYDEKEEVPDIYLEESSLKVSQTFSTFIPLS
ncbi:unnamed protein product, partial [Meganyctiphanes norvegica]